MVNLSEVFQKEIASKLMKQFGYTSIMEVPKIEKITLNMGVGEAINNKAVLTKAIEQLSLIAGQKAVPTKAKKSIASFKIREGWPIGCKVTLRKQRMYDFLERLISIAIPRIRDFRGFNLRGFDGRGNYTLGIVDQTIFPEINLEKMEDIHGLNIAITTSAKTNEEGIALLKAFNFPLKQAKIANEEGA